MTDDYEPMSELRDGMRIDWDVRITILNSRQSATLSRGQDWVGAAFTGMAASRVARRLRVSARLCPPAPPGGSPAVPWRSAVRPATLCGRRPEV
jgi:hypothetical protein